MPLPSTRTNQELQSQGSWNKEDSYCQVERFCIISILAQNWEGAGAVPAQ